MSEGRRGILLGFDHRGRVVAFVAQALNLQLLDVGNRRRRVAKPFRGNDHWVLSAAVFPGDIKMPAPRVVETIPATLAEAQFNLPLLGRVLYVSGFDDAWHDGDEVAPDGKL